MLHRLKAVAFALVAPLVLASCLFVPGKFDSALTIHADRSFTFSYKGEVMAVDLQGFMGKAMQMGMEEGAKAKAGKKDKAPEKEPDFTLTPEEKAKQDETFRKLAVEVAKETGYRTVEYRGDGMFWIDYQISGTLDHGFVFPYNLDNQMIMPWIAVELRGKDLIRIKAPGYVRMSGNSGMGNMGDMSALAMMPGGMGEAFTRLQGTFTLTTDAELVSQNNEEGAVTTGKDKVVTWKTDTTTKDAPMASVRVRAIQ